MAKQTTKRRGRPSGRKNVRRARVIVLAPQCPACGSTDRTPYEGNHTTSRATTHDTAGRSFNHATWKRCACSACGQPMTHVIYEKRAA